MKKRATSLLSGVILSLAIALPALAEKATPRRININVTEKGFEPSAIAVKKGEEVTLVFLRKTDRTCAKDVRINVSEKEKIERKLPLDKPVEVTTAFAKAGKISYACSMDMITGEISVNE